jgi:signal peptidase
MSGGIQVNAKRIREYLSWGIGFILVAFLSIYIVVQLVAPDLTVTVFGFKPYVVITPSMEPVLNVDDMIVVRKFDLADANVGDIITFEADIDYNGTDEIVTHYIYSIENQTLDDPIIRTNRHFTDDREPVPDTWLLSEEDVLGAYWFRIPQLGLLTGFLQSPFGIAAIAVNVGVIVGIVYLIKHNKKPQAPDET